MKSVKVDPFHNCCIRPRVRLLHHLIIGDEQIVETRVQPRSNISTSFESIFFRSTGVKLMHILIVKTLASAFAFFPFSFFEADAGEIIFAVVFRFLVKVCIGVASSAYEVVSAGLGSFFAWASRIHFHCWSM